MCRPTMHTHRQQVYARRNQVVCILYGMASVDCAVAETKLHQAVGHSRLHPWLLTSERQVINQ